ncbi:hypothetical protein LOC68_25010 [Blastopirellula sp. JC732]|uniref:Uncharacterized protein n=1 Tax=Blastopirellula sediminis TaxID=2894196 RepID=A0A9X1MSN2_9BACT|nr:hypothetical protein [Blastopirellula sediminis]MCC9605030.1 hypothetical protein [Blastopirellula sediminis]MCC9631670.1 hypothetical protein [Blastopirellula sediminis]
MSFEEPPASEPNPRRFGQFSLLTLILLTTTIGVLIPLFTLPQQCAQARLQLSHLLRLETDAFQQPWRQISASRRNVPGSQGFAWEVFVPNGDHFQLAWTTSGLQTDRATNIATNAASLTAGEHVIVIRYLRENEVWLLQTLVDDRVVLEERQPATWNPQLGSYSPSSGIDAVQMPPQAGRCFLHDEVFCMPDREIEEAENSGKAATGLRVWIEKVNAPY